MITRPKNSNTHQYRHGKWVCVDATKQSLVLYDGDGLLQEYSISTAKAGLGQQIDSYQTPLGWHIIRAKIGENAPENTVFVGRRQTGETYSDSLRAKFPHRDWIITRILWLSGLEAGKNRLKNVDTMRRYIYIHGTPEHNPIGIPFSKGCICMRNKDILRFFDTVVPGTPVLIKES